MSESILQVWPSTKPPIHLTEHSLAVWEIRVYVKKNEHLQNIRPPIIWWPKSVYI